MKFKIKKFENCFGIKKMEIDYKDCLYQNSIYSSNGIFKTSFAKVFKCIGNGEIESIKDRICEKKSKIELLDENDNIINLSELKNRIIVFSRELEENDQKILENKDIAKLAISNEQKARYQEIENTIYDIENKLNSICLEAKIKEEELLEVLGINSSNIVSNLKELCGLFSTYKEIDISNIDIKKINKKPYIQIDSEEFKKDISSYIEIVNDCMQNSGFDEGFNILNYKELMNELKKTDYISKEKGRGLIFKNNQYYDFAKFEESVEDEIKKINSDKEVISRSKKLVKDLGESQEAVLIQRNIINDNNYLKAVVSGRKNILLNYLNKKGFDFDRNTTIINDIYDKYIDLVKDINESKNEFENAKEIFVERFKPIFEIEIQNLESSLSGVSLPTIVFKHKSNINKSMKENEIKEILSSGEKTTLRIIGFIAEYLTKKEEDIIIILDDVIETFDYSNRYAFIEYIKEIVDEDKCVIILTHNFDFYRTLKIKVGNLDNLSVYRKQDETVKLYKPGHINIEEVVNTNNINSFISSIPFVREAQKIIGADTTKLVKCLHYQKETKTITFNEIYSEFNSKGKIEYGEELYFDKLLELAKKISNSQLDNYDIKNKTILSIACRLLIEEKIVGNDFSKLDGIGLNQTSQLRERNKDKFGKEFLQILDRVLLSTADYIHVNSFMYEPLIDIDSNYLQALYKDIENFDDSKIWK